MKKVLFFLLIIIMLSSCKSKRMNYIIVFDNSSSVPASVRDRYIATLQETVLPELNGKDKLSLLFADGCSENKGERIFDLDLSELDFSSNKDGINYAEKNTKIRMRRYVIDTLKSTLLHAVEIKREERENCGGFTDILSTLIQAQSLVEQKVNLNSKFEEVSKSIIGHENYEYETCILIFSDMINENMAKTYDFTQFATANQNAPKEKLNILNDERKFPNLKGVKVLVFGATSPIKEASLAALQNENVKLFWEGYFERSGAQLLGYGYDTKIEIRKYLKANNL